MRVLYLDCFSGISGDMFLGALLDLGVIEVEAFVAQLQRFLPFPFDITIRQVRKGSISATQVSVVDPSPSHTRSAKEMVSFLQSGLLPQSLQSKAQAILQVIAEAEGRVHGCHPEEVHFHEIGGGDTLVDIVGVLYALELLGVQEVYSSPIPTGRGFVRTSHGLLPVPAPVTLELLRGVPVYTGSEEGELTTPTGAALVTHLVTSFGPCPHIVVQKIGYGAGLQDFTIPNVLRVILGELEGRENQERNVLLETNIDDMSPQIVEYLAERLFEAGALDVFVTPIYMKKHRPAFMLSVLAPISLAPRLRTLIFEETTTLGVREHEVVKWALPRKEVVISTPWGTVRGKEVHKSGKTVTLPEYEECKKIAQKTGLPLQEVLERLRKTGP